MTNKSEKDQNDHHGRSGVNGGFGINGVKMHYWQLSVSFILYK